MQPVKIKPASLISTSLPVELWSQFDPETQRLARLLNTLLTLLLFITLFVYLNVFFSPNPVIDAITATLLLDFVLVGRWVLLRGRVRLSAGVLITGLWLTLVAATFVSQMEGNGPFVGLVLVIVIAGLLLGGAAGFLVALLSSAAGLAYLAISLSPTALLPVLVPYSPVGFMVTMVIIFFGAAGLIQLASSSLHEAVQSANQNEQAMAESNRALEKMRLSLEEQVSERTRILEQRTSYLQAAIEVGRASASILEVQPLMQTSVELIRDQFDLYYVGLFQMDPGGEWAILKAGTGEPGEAMIARGHKIAYGRGMIGWSIANAQPRVADVAAEDVVRLATPELPETRSEAAIPLRSRGRVLGALSVQSDQPGAFGEMEIATFQALADQLAIALDNARLISESQQAVEEARRAYGRISRRAWSEFLRTASGRTASGALAASDGSPSLTYRYEMGASASQVDLKTLITPGQTAGIEQAKQEVLHSGRPAQVQVADVVTLLLPIHVRDQIIGVASFVKKPAALGAVQTGSTPPGPAQRSIQPALPAWKTEEIELLQTIVEQLGIAIDTARLYHDSQRMAFREQLVGEVTGRIRQTLDLQTVMRTAVEEIQRTLNLPEVVISLAPPEETEPAVNPALASAVDQAQNEVEP